MHVYMFIIIFGSFYMSGFPYDFFMNASVLCISPVFPPLLCPFLCNPHLNFLFHYSLLTCVLVWSPFPPLKPLLEALHDFLNSIGMSNKAYMYENSKLTSTNESKRELCVIRV